MTTTRLLFLCPHAAGKSVLAATYFRAAAVRSGLDVEINVAGPDPDTVNMPIVEDALTAQGFSVGWHPRTVTAADVRTADHVISVGCAREDIPGGTATMTWDVPLPSTDLRACMTAVHGLAEALAAELASG